jgi:hypothetical protein
VTTHVKSAEWRKDAGRFTLGLHAIRLEMRTLAMTIVAVCVVIGSGVAGLLIVLNSGSHAFLHLPARLQLILIGAAAGFGAYALLWLTFRRGAHDWMVVIDAEHVSLSRSGLTWSAPLAEVTMILIRPDTEYARLVVRTARSSISLMPHLAAQSTKAGAGGPLAPFPTDLSRLLAGAGLPQTSGDERRPIVHRRG